MKHVGNQIAVYSGSFDPITNGHLDIIERTAKIFGEVHIVILHNPKKTYLFSREEREALISKAVTHLSNVTVSNYDGLVVHAARMKQASVIIRGLRAITDFEYEMQMASANKMLDSEIETFF